ncbi:MAG: DNA cytosine methyltransferase [Nitrospirae bacterium]|nr:DNA cytosine methyltransferase [Nitrospirota bacterium]
MKFASLFSGCGGFDLGFIASGFSSCGAYDCEPEAVETFSANIKSPVYNVDLTDGIPNERSLYGIDALISGPPCQGFSTAGKRLIDDKRNDLLPLTGQLARRIYPKVLVVENVAGALSGAHARYWNELDTMMRLAGYRTHTIRCQATDLGMAQLRRRVLFFAWRTSRDTDFTFPHYPAGSLRTVLAGVSRQKNHHPKRLDPGSREWQIATRIKPGQKLSNVRGGENAVATWDIPEVFGAITEDERTVLELLRRLRRQERQRDYGDADPVSIPRLKAALGNCFHRHVEVLVTKGYLRRVEGGIDLAETFNGKFRRLSWHKPSCTVDTRFGSPRYFLHPSQQRGFTVREAARIQGFSDNYIFHGNEKSQYRLIGNAVPPPLAALAADFVKRLLGRVL